jgi:hypothetical protein
MSNDPVRYFLEVLDLKDKGMEVVLSVVNEGEDWLYVRGASVDIEKDGRSFGRHSVSFPGGGLRPVRLAQFESTEGRFHLARDPKAKSLNFSVLLDYRYGDHLDTRRISRKVETQQLMKSG